MLETFGNNTFGHRSILSVCDSSLRLHLASTKDGMEHERGMNWIEWIAYCVFIYGNLWLWRLWHRTLCNFQISTNTQLLL